MLKSVAPSIISLGKAVETLGRQFAGPAAASFPASYGSVLPDVTKDDVMTYHESLGKAVPGSFQAPCAKVDASAKVEESSSVWYAATLLKNVSVGKYSSLQERVSAADSTSVGNYVVVGPGASLGSKVQLSDRVMVGAGAKLGDGVKVESDAIIAAGAEISSGDVVKTNELWEGSPAQKVRDLTKEEVESIVEAAELSAELASKHNMEHLKNEAALESQRQRFSENPQAFMEELAENPAFKHEVKRRGLIFNDN